MTTKYFNGDTFVLPYRGRLGYQIQRTLAATMSSETGIALYAAMNLRGKAKTYAGKYVASFVRFAEVNKDKLHSGHVGPKGGWGYRYIGGKTCQ